ncbi:hypothetical protein CCMSSC00406_0006194 [Pleurotus cornucopiae]|uniref:Uncharacterized protein n=1 Tax=Pleurotus cornucopiae TaxID=5321 RepID=A0ACB7JBC3_PLECO|nr:hypothetical protein CCMSSC00406_0006194 [Pleurotus cornucopiae]
MGASGSGKTSMRSLIFSNNPASLTARLGATIDVEQNHVRFLGDLILNLWDCGGQDAFMDSYLTTQRSTIFKHVGVMIYVFDAETREMNKDLEYYRDCLDGLRTYSPEASVFLLVHKMDLVRDRNAVFTKKQKELTTASAEATAWSSIVHTLIPNAALLSKHLNIFSRACGATEVILFERTTFLVIATSTGPNTSTDSDPHELNATRYERTSELVKAFKHSCSRVREEFHSLEMELPDFTAVLDEMTKNAYVLVIVHNPTIGTLVLPVLDVAANSSVLRVETAALKLNIRMARRKFEELQGDSLVS